MKLSTIKLCNSGQKNFRNSTGSPSVPGVLFAAESLRALSASFSVMSPSQRTSSSSFKKGTLSKLKNVSLSCVLCAGGTRD